MTAAILIVDDDHDIRGVLRELMEEEGYQVEEARNGEEALRALKKAARRYVVLLDLRMPVLDGVGVFNAVAKDRALRRQHAFILATADNRTLPLSFVQQLTSMEIPVLSKPFDEPRLYSLVAAAIARLRDN